MAVAAALLAVAAAPALSAQPAPHFASFAQGQVSLREGPSFQHRVLWVYRRKHLPVLVLAEYDVWRRVRTPDGTVGWVHTALLSSTRYVLVNGAKKAALRDDDDPSSKVLALAAPGVVAKLERCRPNACEVVADGTEGWINRKQVWGVMPGEDID